MKKAFIVGIGGKMGGMLCETANSAGYEITGGLDAVENGIYKTFEKASDVNVDYDVIIDFSRPQTLENVIALAKLRRAPAVIATTGYNEKELERISELANEVPVFRSANMSIGIAAIKAAAIAVKKILGDGFDIEIVEKHHNRKVDSPSGTAIMLADSLCEKEKQVFNRNGKRNKGEIGITSVRGGDVVGEHEIGFYGENEIVTISHSARSRALFALGAFKAADLIIASPPGMYDFDDLIKQSL